SYYSVVDAGDYVETTRRRRRSRRGWWMIESLIAAFVGYFSVVMLVAASCCGAVRLAQARNTSGRPCRAPATLSAAIRRARSLHVYPPCVLSRLFGEAYRLGGESISI